MDIKPLRYIFELAVVGMKDGAAPYSARPPLIRLQLLMTYKRDWPRLHWTHEQQVRVPATATKIDVSGIFYSMLDISPWTCSNFLPAAPYALLPRRVT